MSAAMRSAIGLGVLLALAPQAVADAEALQSEVETYVRQCKTVDSWRATMAATDASRWAFDLDVYLWAAGVKGDVGARGTTVPVDAGFDELFDQLDGAFMFRFSGKRDRWGGYLDFLWIGLEVDTTGPLGAPATAKSTIFIVEAAGTYEILRKSTGETSRFLLDVYAGLRVYGGDNEITGPLTKRDQSDTWVDPIVGLGAVLDSDRWGVALRADVGGFGAGSDFAWSVLAGARYRFTKLFSMAVGYRWLDFERTSGSGADRFTMDLQLSGPFLAFTFSF